MRPSQRLSRRIFAASKPAFPLQPVLRLPFFAARPTSILRRIPPRLSHTPFPARQNSSLTVSSSPQNRPAVNPPQVPSYDLTFTCKPCGHRSTHRVSKQGFHKGTVLIQCPECKNRHVLADHLKVFMDEASSLEDILKRAEPGGDLNKLLKKGRLGMREGELVGREGEEDIEFWDDGTETIRQPEGGN